LLHLIAAAFRIHVSPAAAAGELGRYLTARLDRHVEITKTSEFKSSAGSVMIRVPAGSFTMGRTVIRLGNSRTNSLS